MPKRKHRRETIHNPLFKTFTTTHVTSFDSLERAIREQKQALSQADAKERSLRSKIIGARIRFSSQKEHERERAEKKLKAFFIQREHTETHQDRLREEILTLQNDVKQLDHKIRLAQRELHEVEQRKDSGVGWSFEQELVDVQREKEQINKQLTLMYQELQQILGVVQSTMGGKMSERASHPLSEGKRIDALLKDLGKTISPTGSGKKMDLVEEMPERSKPRKVHSKLPAAPADQKEVGLLLKKLDALLVKLPEGEIQDFAKSEDFELYKKIMGKYKVQ